MPAGHAARGDLPLLVDLAGFTGSGLSHTNWVGFRARPARAARPADRRGPECRPWSSPFPIASRGLAAINTSNSASTGLWEDYLLHEMLPAIEERFRLRQGLVHRGVFGKSSRRLWRDHACIAALRHLGCRRLPLRRYGV